MEDTITFKNFNRSNVVMSVNDSKFQLKDVEQNNSILFIIEMKESPNQSKQVSNIN